MQTATSVPTTRAGNPPTLTAYDVDPAVGTDETEFTFKIDYTDVDDDPPEPGFPRIYIYSDTAGSLLYKAGKYDMSAADAGDTIFSDGKTYIMTLIYDDNDFIDEPTTFSYKYEIKSTGETDVITSSLRHGPLVDWLPLIYRNNTIDSSIWYTSDEVECSVVIDDGKGSGVNGSSISYRQARSSTELSRWYAFKPMANSLAIYLSHNVVFHEGDQNYYQWNATDMAGIGPILSPVYRIKVDVTEIEFKDPQPPSGSTTDSDSVEFQVTVTDTDTYNINNNINVSGINKSSLQYRIRYPGHSWGGWNSSGIDEVSATGDTTTVKVLIKDLITGDNHIQFQGKDNAGNGETYSEEFIIVRSNNIPESPKWIKPNSTSDTTPRITWGPGYDKDGDPLEYFIQLGILVQEDYIFSWRSAGTDTYYDITEDLKRYVTYVVQVRCSDGRDLSEVMEIMMNVTSTGTNIPPLPPTNITTAYTAVNPYICWDESYDPDSGNLTYYIRMGTAPGKGDIFEWDHVPTSCYYQLPMGLNITEGIFHIEVQAFDGEGYSDIAHTTLKIVYFEIYIENFALNLTPGREFEYPVKILNKAVLSDNVTLYLNGTLFSVATIYVEGEEYDPQSNQSLEYYFGPNELREILIRFEVPKGDIVGNYTFNMYAYSENGEVSGILEKDYADVKEPPPPPPKEKDSWGELCMKYWLLIIVVEVLIFVGVNIAIYFYRKRKEGYVKDKDEEEEEPPPFSDEESGEDDKEMEVEPITTDDLEDLDDLLEPPPDDLTLPETPEGSLLPGDAIGEVPDPEDPTGGLSLPPARVDQEGIEVEVPTIDAVCTVCGEIESVDVTLDPRTLPCPHCGSEGSLTF
jgi:hypothetical protein